MHWTTLPPFPRISRGLIRSGLSAASRFGPKAFGPLFGCPLDPSLRPKSTNDEIQNGSNRIRTSEGHRQRIYNPPPLTSRASTHVTQLRQRWSRLYITNLDLTVVGPRSGPIFIGCEVLALRYDHSCGIGFFPVRLRIWNVGSSSVRRSLVFGPFGPQTGLQSTKPPSRIG